VEAIVDDSVRAVMLAGGSWSKVRAGTLIVTGALVLGQAQPVLRYVDDETGVEMTVPRGQVVAYDGDLRDLEADRRQAAWQAELRRREEEARYRYRGTAIPSPWTAA
jgi:hypothetical protein